MKDKLVKIICFACAAGIFSLFPVGMQIKAAQAEVFIITHPSVDVNTLSKSSLKSIYTGVTVKWNNGQQIKLTTLEIEDVHQEFARKYTNKSPAQFRSYWIKQVFSGKGVLPKNFKTEKDLIDYVSNTEGAIGYISSKSNSKTIKFIRITDK